jgi:hypothetical protein
MLPAHFEALIQAGNTARFMDDLAAAGRYYEEAARVRADSWVPPYNLACLRALGGDPHAAMSLLDEAIQLGFRLPQLLDANEDFTSLRGLPNGPRSSPAPASAPARRGRERDQGAYWSRACTSACECTRATDDRRYASGAIPRQRWKARVKCAWSE